jgi:hypothetical protein
VLIQGEIFLTLVGSNAKIFSALFFKTGAHGGSEPIAFLTECLLLSHFGFSDRLLKVLALDSQSLLGLTFQVPQVTPQALCLLFLLFRTVF